jgi:hypothetical protein
MYLSKQWRESRYITGLAVLGLLLLLPLAVKGNIIIDVNGHSPDSDQFSGFLAGFFYTEAVWVAFWGWLIASIGIGKNLGEESGAFLFTRPRSRKWFLWNDWGFAMAQLVLIILLANGMVGFFIGRILVLMHSPGRVGLAHGNSVALISLMALNSVCVLLFSGLVYSLTYFSTVMMRRASGVIIGAGILVGYLVLRGIIGHYYPSVQLPNPIPRLFDFTRQGVELSNHLGLSLLVRAAIMLAFPVAAQLVLDRAEI